MLCDTIILHSHLLLLAYPLATTFDFWIR